MSVDEHSIFSVDIELPAIVQKKADTAFSMIKKKGTGYMENFEKENLKKTLKKAGAFKRPTAAAVAVCALALCGITALAAGYHYWSRSMSGTLQADEVQQIELIQNGVADILDTQDTDDSALAEIKAVTVGGVTVKPMEVIADSHFAHISFSISGYTLGEQVEPSFEHMDADCEGVVAVNGSFYDGIVSDSNGNPVYDDGTPIKLDESGAVISHYTDDDGTLEYVITCISAYDRTILGKTIHVELENIGTTYHADYENVLSGKWEFDIPVTEKNSAKTYALGASVGDSGATVTTVELSPISIKVNYDFQGEKVSQEGSDKSYTNPPLFCGVRLKDGTMLPYLADGGSGGYTDETAAQYYFMSAFDRVIDVDNVDALLFRKADGTPSGDNLYIVPLVQQQ